MNVGGDFREVLRRATELCEAILLVFGPPAGSVLQEKCFVVKLHKLISVVSKQRLNFHFFWSDRERSD